MKFLNFFKTTWGIIILLILAVGIILAIMNWAAIVAWWNDEAPAPGETENPGGTGRTTGDRASLINQLVQKFETALGRGLTQEEWVSTNNATVAQIQEVLLASTTARFNWCCNVIYTGCRYKGDPTQLH